MKFSYLETYERRQARIFGFGNAARLFAYSRARVSKARVSTRVSKVLTKGFRFGPRDRPAQSYLETALAVRLLGDESTVKDRHAPLSPSFGRSPIPRERPAGSLSRMDRTRSTRIHYARVPRISRTIAAAVVAADAAAAFFLAVVLIAI